jgi:hypothetical protein
VIARDDEQFDSFMRAVAASPELAPLRTVTAGEVVAGRFLIEGVARAGGMGTVYRALDRLTGGSVAFKVVPARGEADRTRFLQEARVLAELTHPAIVRYVGHGEVEAGQLFLAMEWLSGEDLADRLGRSGLSVEESVALARRTGEVERGLDQRVRCMATQRALRDRGGRRRT